MNSHASGELIISLGVGLSFLALVAIAYTQSNASAKAASRFLTGMLFCLAFVDGIHSIVQIDWLDPILTTIEDGGEMVVMSFILSFVLLLPGRIRRVKQSTT